MISLYQGSRVLIKKSESSGMKSLEQEGEESEGRKKSKSTNTNDFLNLATVNSKSNSWRMTIHFEYFPPAIVETICRSWGCIQKSQSLYAKEYNDENFEQLEQ